MEGFEEIIEVLNVIEEDDSVPRNIRTKIGDTIKYLNDGGCEKDVQKDRVLQDLDEISGDPNMPTYTRTQLWGVISSLESE